MNIQDFLFALRDANRYATRTGSMRNTASRPVPRRRGKLKGWQRENRRKGNRWSR
jgi:hypothetical protein